MHYMLGGWYTPSEIGKRASIFWVAGSLGQMFSGILQAAAYNNLSGIHGLAGWRCAAVFLWHSNWVLTAKSRWLFIIDAVITLPLAIFGFLFFPPLPLQGKKCWWLSSEEFSIAQSRLLRFGRVGKKAWTRTKLKSLLFSWHTYFLRKSTQPFGW